MSRSPPSGREGDRDSGGRRARPLKIEFAANSYKFPSGREGNKCRERHGWKENANSETNRKQRKWGVEQMPRATRVEGELANEILKQKDIANFDKLIVPLLLLCYNKIEELEVCICR